MRAERNIMIYCRAEYNLKHYIVKKRTVTILHELNTILTKSNLKNCGDINRQKQED